MRQPSEYSRERYACWTHLAQKTCITRRLLVVGLAGILLVQSSIAQPAERTRVDEDSVALAASSLLNVIRDSAAQAGADLDNQTVHLIIGCSTGHFPNDPLAALATRELAWRMASDLLVEGDEVSVYAWEMAVWNHPGFGLNPFRIPTRRADHKRAIKEMFPLTARQGSRGGHDTERAIVELDRLTGRPSNGIMILLTNSVASIASPDAKPIGADDRNYAEVLTHWKRIMPASPSGASTVLSYNEHLADGRTVSRRIEALILIRTPFGGEALRTPRTYQAEKVEVARVPVEEPKRHQNGQSLVPLIIGVALLPFLLYVLIRTFGVFTRGEWVLDIDGSAYDLSEVRPNRIICTIAGRQLSSDESDGKPVHLVPNVGQVIIAKLRLKPGSKVTVETQHDCELVSVNGTTTSSSGYTMHPGRDYKCVFAIPGGDGGKRNVELNIRLRRSE